MHEVIDRLKCLLGRHDWRAQKPELGFPAHRFWWACTRCGATRG